MVIALRVKPTAAVIDTEGYLGRFSIEFGAAAFTNVTFDAGASGTLKLAESFEFSRIISGFNQDDHIDLLDYGIRGRYNRGLSRKSGRGRRHPVGDRRCAHGEYSAARPLFGRRFPCRGR